MRNHMLVRGCTAFLLALSLACHGPTHTADSPSPTPTPTSAPTSASTTVNRDQHADPDVEKYIDRLTDPERIEDLQIERVVELLALPGDATIGDLGCGPGLFAVAFAKACPRGVVYASDIEPRQLDQVRERVAEQKLRNVIPVLASFGDPHFPPARLDVVFIGDTYHHLQDRVAYMKRLQSTLKPGGKLVVLEYKPGDLPIGPPPDHKLKEGELVRELAQAGYVEVERFATHPYHDFVIWRVVQSWEQGK